MSKLLHKPLLAALFAAALPLAAAAQIAPVPSAVPVTEPADQNYVIGPGDAVEVKLLERPDFATTAKVSADGAITLPLIGPVPASNRTARTLTDEIKAALVKGGYFANPNLSVQVTSYAARYVTVLGAVGAPGLVPMDRAYRLSEILARVGGVRDSGADYVIVRPSKGTERRLSVRAVATGDISQDPFISPGDTIFSPPADVFYVSGQVKAPGSYQLLPGMTARMAITRAGGLTDLGSERGVKITRGDKAIRTELDSPIKAGDVVMVGERLF